MVSTLRGTVPFFAQARHFFDEKTTTLGRLSPNFQAPTSYVTTVNSTPDPRLSHLLWNLELPNLLDTCWKRIPMDFKYKFLESVFETWSNITSQYIGNIMVTSGSPLSSHLWQAEIPVVHRSGEWIGRENVCWWNQMELIKHFPRTWFC